jgi:hypothetical protein
MAEVAVDPAHEEEYGLPLDFVVFGVKGGGQLRTGE